MRTLLSQPESKKEWGTAEAQAGDTDMNDDDVIASNDDVVVPVRALTTLLSPTKVVGHISLHVAPRVGMVIE